VPVAVLHRRTAGEETVATLKVMCARSMHRAVGVLGRDFARAGGHQVDFDFGTVGALQAKLDAGESADVLILSDGMIDRLEAAGVLVPGSRAAVAKTFVAVCTREGADPPDIATPEAFKRTLEAARAVAMSDPAVGGSAAVYVPTVFERLGLATAMKAKSLLQPNGVEVARRVVEGKADLGLTLSGEVASVPGAVIAGPLPPPFGQDTVYCAAVSAASAVPHAGRAFIKALTAAPVRDIWKNAGFEVK
jgi:molybdate transport system substrate-binding protein